jgi:hypothetical protein
MLKILPIALGVCISVATMAHAELASRETVPIEVPSGQPVSLIEGFVERSAAGLLARFRFVAPELAERLSELGYAGIEPDLRYLCETYALPRIAAPYPKLIVISVAQQEVGFAASTSDVVQVFESYELSGAECVWQAF